MPASEQQATISREELAELRARLEEFEATLCAIRTGEVDAVVIEKAGGKRFFIQEGAEQPYREMVETMSEGAVTITPKGIILYCNQRFADMARTVLRTIMGSGLLTLFAHENVPELRSAFRASYANVQRLRATLVASDATLVPVNVAMRGQTKNGTRSIAIVVSDLTRWREAEEARDQAMRALRIVNACAEIIMEATDESTMLADACEAIIRIGGYKFAWVGYAEKTPTISAGSGSRAIVGYDHGKTIGFAAAAGAGSAPDIERGRESVELAVQRRCAVIARDTKVQPESAAWIRLTRDACYRASVTIPLQNADDVLGGWIICSDDPDAFGQEELALLTSVANRLAFGIAAQRNKRARSQLAVIVESSVDAIIGRDIIGTITSWNGAAERLFGHRADEVLGRPIEILCPRELKGETEWLVEKLRRGEAVEQFETIRLAKDGRRISVSLTLSPIRDEGGDIIAAAIFMHDITSRRNATEALRFRESALRVEADKLHSILDSMAEAIIVADKDGKIIEANPSAHEIYGIDAVSGTVTNWATKCGLYVANRSTPLTYDENPLVRSIQGLETNGIELYIGRTGRTGAHIDLTGRSIRAADGTVSGGLVVATDITQRKQNEADLLESHQHLQQLVAARTADLAEAKRSNAELERVGRQLEQARGVAEQANKAKTRFLTGITHELRTPLHGILGYAELLSLEGHLDPTQAKRVAAMIGAGEHLLGLINAVLDVSQIEAGRLELHPVEIELVEFCRACLDVVRSKADEKQLPLILKAVAPLRFFGDPTRLRQILLNLLGNAIKFTSSGSVELRLERLEDDAGFRLEVADTGPGVWARHRAKLFQMFERLNAEAVAGIEGAGVGLSLAARLVRAMGGRIGYADNAGGGSVFWVELPAGLADPVSGQVSEASSWAARQSARVLVVDDDAINRDIASKFLTLGGHEVVCLDNGAAAVEEVKSQDFDVVFMDVRMPGMNGLEATRQIRMLPAPRGAVPIIALTAQAFGEQIEMCLKAGMNTHISKPFKQSVLLGMVERIALSADNDAVAPAPAIDTDVHAETAPPAFDQAIFRDNTELLSPEAVREHLETLIARGTALRRELCPPGPLTHAGDPADGAHRLAGGAAMFGFTHLANAARRFETAVESGGSEIAALADELAAAVDAAIAIMRQELAREANTAA